MYISFEQKDLIRYLLNEIYERYGVKYLPIENFNNYMKVFKEKVNLMLLFILVIKVIIVMMNTIL
jgi:hypothetical protein